jgi:hypothetical protein
VKKKKSKSRSKSPKRERGKSPKSEKPTSPEVPGSEKSEETAVEPETTTVLDSSSDEVKANVVEGIGEGETLTLAKGTKKKKIKANTSSESLKGGVLVEESAELSVEGEENSSKPKSGKLRLSKAAAGDAFDPDASMESIGADEGGKKKKKKKTKNKNHRDAEEVHDDPDSSAGSLAETLEIKKKKDDHPEVAPHGDESATPRADEHPGEGSKKKKKKNKKK